MNFFFFISINHNFQFKILTCGGNLSIYVYQWFKLTLGVTSSTLCIILFFTTLGSSIGTPGRNPFWCLTSSRAASAWASNAPCIMEGVFTYHCKSQCSEIQVPWSCCLISTPLKYQVLNPLMHIKLDGKFDYINPKLPGPKTQTLTPNGRQPNDLRKEWKRRRANVFSIFIYKISESEAVDWHHQ